MWLTFLTFHDLLIKKCDFACRHNDKHSSSDIHRYEVGVNIQYPVTRMLSQYSFSTDCSPCVARCVLVYPKIDICAKNSL